MHLPRPTTRGSRRNLFTWILGLAVLSCSGADSTGTGVDVALVIVNAAPRSIVVGATAQATAVLKDTAGNTLTDHAVVWTSSNKASASVDPSTGLIHGIAAGTAAIRATSQGKFGEATITVTLPPPVATKLSITTQPSATAVTGQLLARQPVLQLQDASSNAVNQSGVVVSASVASGGGTLSGTTTASTNASGIATFGNLTINGTGQQTLQFTAPGLTAATSSSIAVSTTPPVASKLGITTQPSATSVSGQVLARQPAVQLQDASGNAISQSNVVVSASIGSGGGALSGTTTATTNASGVANFANIAITGLGSQILQFTAPNLTAAMSAAINLSALPPVATKLGITTQPSSTTTSGQTLAQQPVVQLQDATGAVVSQSGVSVSVAVASGGGTLSGTAAVSTNASGIATFTNLAIAGTGPQTLQFTAPNLTPVISATVTVSAITTGGVLLFEEKFEDANFGSRGWYDLPSGGIASLSTTDHIAGSTHSLQMNFPQGAVTPSPSTAARHLFTPSNAVYVRYWLKHSTNWVGSGQTYHPHELYLLTNLDDQYAGPAFNYLTTYIEDNWMSDGGHPLLLAQDAHNIDVTRINQDLTSVTENRAIAGCNGNPDNTPEITCYQSGSTWYNGKTWRAAQPAFVNATGPNYKGDWHKVEVYYKLNSIVNGIGQRDGIAQYSVDGVLYIDRHDVMFRTGANATMLFNQLVMGPYIGDGSPVAQMLWFDDMAVMTAPPLP